MYPYHFRKKFSERSHGVLIEDCFAEKAKNWLWILGIIIVLVIAFSVVKFSAHVKSPYVDYRREGNIKRVKNVAFTPCTYCKGLLDNQGKCNIPECPLYSPNWGQVNNQPISWPFQKQTPAVRILPTRPWCQNR